MKAKCKINNTIIFPNERWFYTTLNGYFVFETTNMTNQNKHKILNNYSLQLNSY